jgi:membrane-associated protein
VAAERGIKFQRYRGTSPLNASDPTDFVQLIQDFFAYLQDLPALIQWAGVIGLILIVFVETGLLVGFFLPGDSLLVTAGFLVSQGVFSGTTTIWTLGAMLCVAAVVGDQVGYAIGSASGPRIFKREDSRFFKRKHLLRAQDFYQRHGGKTIVIARFVPIVRTFAPVIAGVAQMRYSAFITFNVVGGLLWVWSMLLTGYYLGRLVPGIEHHIDKVILGVIFLSILPGIYGAWRESRRPDPTPAD